MPENLKAVALASIHLLSFCISEKSFVFWMLIIIAWVCTFPLHLG